MFILTTIIIILLSVFPDNIQGVVINDKNIIRYVKYNDSNEILDILNNNNINVNNNKNSLLIGGLNKYINITLRDNRKLTRKIYEMWDSTDKYFKSNRSINTTKMNCYVKNNKEDCYYNYIRVINPIKDKSNVFFICGTNSYYLACLKFNRKNKILNNNDNIMENGCGLCPYNPKDKYYLSVIVGNDIYFAGISEVSHTLPSLYKNGKLISWVFYDIVFQYIYSLRISNKLYLFVNEKVLITPKTYEIHGGFINKFPKFKSAKHDAKAIRYDIFCKYLEEEQQRFNDIRTHLFRKIIDMTHSKQESIIYIAFSDDNIYANASSALCQFSYNNDGISTNGKLLMLKPYLQIIGIKRIFNHLILCYQNYKIERYKIIDNNTLSLDDGIALRKTIKDVHVISNDNNNVSLLCLLSNKNEILFVKLLFSSNKTDFPQLSNTTSSEIENTDLSNSCLNNSFSNISHIIKNNTTQNETTYHPNNSYLDSRSLQPDFSKNDTTQLNDSYLKNGKSSRLDNSSFSYNFIMIMLNIILMIVYNYYMFDTYF